MKRGRQGLCLGLLLILAGAAGAAAPGGEARTANFSALCVGLRYPGTRDSLQYTTKDARDVAQALRSASGFSPDSCRVELLVDDDPLADKPTPPIIRRRLREMAAGAGNMDRLVFFFSGHGLQIENGRTVLVASGGRGAQDPSGHLRLSEIREIMAGSQAKYKLVIVDACHSGGKAAGDDEFDPGLIGRDLAPERGKGAADESDDSDVLWLTSCAVGERSWEDVESGNGLFTRYLLETLGADSHLVDANEDGMVSLEEMHRHITGGIFSYIRGRVVDHNDRIWLNRHQSPQVGKGARSGLRPGLPRDLFVCSYGEGAAGAAPRPSAPARPEPNPAIPEPGPSEPPKPLRRMTLDCGGGVSLELAQIPAGRFRMGSPPSEEGREEDEVPHEVTLTDDFFMGVHEVTQAQWKAVMGSDPSWFKGADFPVERVSWDEAVEFCRLLSARTGRRLRLPTEAEWEYACRAGTTTPFNTGPDIDTAQANYDGNHAYGNDAKGGYRRKTTPVGSFPPNAWGLFDMHGNVYEWCADLYGDYGDAKTAAASAASSSAPRVCRGGSWTNYPQHGRSAVRNANPPDFRDVTLGFRVALDE